VAADPHLKRRGHWDWRIYIIYIYIYIHLFGPGSVVGIATSYGLGGPGIRSRWERDFPHQSRPAYPASYTMSTGYFLGAKSGRGVMLTPHPLLVPWSWKNSAILLVPLWAVRPVHNLSACTEPQFLYRTSVPVQNLSACTEPQCLPVQ
jgi:hypothetical protein